MPTAAVFVKRRRADSRCARCLIVSASDGDRMPIEYTVTERTMASHSHRAVASHSHRSAAVASHSERARAMTTLPPVVCRNINVELYRYRCPGQTERNSSVSSLRNRQRTFTRRFGVRASDDGAAPRADSYVYIRHSQLITIIIIN